MNTRMGTVGVSVGTAGTLGLQRVRQTDTPTTAYLMVGERCRFNCAFCAQARLSTAQAHWLSRVAWPPFPAEEALPAVAQGFAQGRVVRCCLQVTASPDYGAQALSLVGKLHALSNVPLCVSIVAPDAQHIASLLDCGVERVSLALDAASERVYCQAKGGQWQQQLDLVCESAMRFPGRIGTHLIAGLGETEQELVTLLQEMVERQVTVGLFAFTPVRGTAWAARRPPALSSYRRIQAARYLLAAGACRIQDMSFTQAGEILSFGLPPTQLRLSLAGGEAFQTAGCPGCNRPYYNERPGKAMYNYPRALRPEEITAAISLVLADLADE